jgi:hypothetical protein
MESKTKPIRQDVAAVKNKNKRLKSEMEKLKKQMKELSTKGNQNKSNKSTQAKKLSSQGQRRRRVTNTIFEKPPWLRHQPIFHHSARPRGRRQRRRFTRRIINSWSSEATKQIAQEQRQEESRSRQIQLKIEQKLTVAYGFCADPSLTAFQNAVKIRGDTNAASYFSTPANLAFYDLTPDKRFPTSPSLC